MKLAAKSAKFRLLTQEEIAMTIKLFKTQQSLYFSKDSYE